MLKHTVLGLFVVGLTACTVTTSPAGSPGGSGGSSPDPNPGGASTDPGSGTSGSGGGGTINEAANNDDFGTAQVVEAGSTVNARWEKPDDQDYYAVTIPAGTQDGYLQVTVSETDPNATPFLDLFRADKSRIEGTSAHDGTTNPFTYKKNVSAGKQYFVVLKDGAGSRDAIIPYTVKFEFIPVVDAFERNDDFPDAKPITAGTPFNLVLFAGVDTNDGTDNDFFTVDIPGDKTKLHLEITNDSPADEAQTHFVTVYDANKSQLGATSEPNARANLSEEFNVTSGEKVFLKFYDGASTNSATPSKVTVSFL